MKYVKILAVCFILSIISVVSGASAASQEYLLSIIDIPGFRGVVTVPGGSVYHTGGNQYVMATYSKDKWNDKDKPVEARVKSTLHPIETSSWKSVDLLNKYYNLGDLDSNHYNLQFREKTSSIFGIFLNGWWKVNN